MVKSGPHLPLFNLRKAFLYTYSVSILLLTSYHLSTWTRDHGFNAASFMEEYHINQKGGLFIEGSHYIGKALVISTDNQLHPNVSWMAKQCGFYPYLFEAVQPVSNRFADYSAFLDFCFDSINMTNPIWMSAGEIALVGSHRTALAAIASDSDLHDDDWSLILESDARLNPHAMHNARTLIETAISQQNDSAPGFMYLGACLPTCKNISTSIGHHCYGYCTHALAFTKRQAKTFFHELYCTRSEEGLPCGWMCKNKFCVIDNMMRSFFSQSDVPPIFIGYDYVSPDNGGHRGLIYQCCRTNEIGQNGTSLRSIQFNQSDQSPRLQNHGCFRAEFTGRLGNLMFQYAALVGTCIKHALRPEECAGFSTRDLSEDNTAKPTKMFHDIFGISNVSCPIDSSVIYQEHADSMYAIRYNSEVLEQTPGTLFRGYFQSFKYFDHAKDVIRQLYRFPDDVVSQTSNFLADVRRQASMPAEGEVACVSVRRGDKIRMDNQHFYNRWSLSIEYYQKALSVLRQQDQPMAFVYLVGGGTTPEMVAEDRQWVIDTFIRARPDEHSFLEPEGFSAANSLHMMTQCEHLIVSSSSFSWWAGYLSTKARTIIAPKVIQTDFVAEDYYPPSWTLLDDE